MLKKSLDLSTISGILLTLLTIYTAISFSGNVKAFLNLSSFLIVFLGTFLISTAAFSLSKVITSYFQVFKMIFWRQQDPTKIAIDVIKIAEFARKDGIVDLENKAQNEGYNPFLLRGIIMIVDGVDIKKLEEILSQEIISNIEQQSKVISVLRKSAEISPAMGLIGTIIELIQMFGSLEDLTKIGPAMGLALLTTFYGTILAYIVFFPLASKLENNLKEEILINKIYLSAILSIYKKENPRHLETVINSLLSERNHISYYK